jgi:hypothetical protein
VLSTPGTRSDPLGLDIDAPAAAIERALVRRATLAYCRVPVALEVVHLEPRESWWAIEVSVPDGDMHRVRVDRVAELAPVDRKSPGKRWQMKRNADASAF